MLFRSTIDEHSGYIVIGSSSWIAGASKAPVFDAQMQTFNWVALDPTFYSPCGTMQAAGYSVSWLRRTLCQIDQRDAEAEGESVYELMNRRIAASPPGANGAMFLPYLLGERSPRWNSDARAAFLGLTMTSTRDDMMRAVLEGVGFNLRVILESISAHQPIGKIKAIGGGATNRVWLQILADIWQKPIEVMQFLEEATSMGAAVCAGVGIGAFSGFDKIHELNPSVGLITPNPQNALRYDRGYALFNRLYAALEPLFPEFR